MIQSEGTFDVVWLERVCVSVSEEGEIDKKK